jgi:hypothetical protein
LDLSGSDRIALVPDLIDQLLLRSRHLLDDLGALGAARELVGIRAQAALGRQAPADRLPEPDRRSHAIEHLAHASGLRAGHRIEDRLAGFQQLHDLVHGGMRLDLVFAGLQAFAVVEMRSVR